jgi:hypothetical protein
MAEKMVGSDNKKGQFRVIPKTTPPRGGAKLPTMLPLALIRLGGSS